jgi:hypothetical protein
MRKLVEAKVRVRNRAIVTDGIHEKLTNTGIIPLTKEPRSNALTKGIIDLLKTYNMIDNEDDVVNIMIEIKS